MNKRIAAAVAMVGSMLLGPAAVEAASAPGYDMESAGGTVLDHRQEDQSDDHDHDGDGRPDHDPEDHDDDDKPDPEDDED